MFRDNRKNGIYYKVRKLEKILAPDKELLEELSEKEPGDYLGNLPKKTAVRERKGR